jgi:redox-sensitive bicupin YhaK (pirin superfamily)
MEIVTYVLEGALEHQDSLGSGSVMRPGDVQRMSAGTGIRHSELNHSATEPVHFLQIWIEPERTGLAPSYAQAHVDPADRQGRLVLVASRDGRAGSLSLNRDADIHVARLAPGEAVGHTPEAGRMLWLQVASGSVRLNGQELAEGDGAALTGEPALEIEGVEAAEILLFDMAG